MNIAIDLDDTITYSPEFFSILTQLFIAEHRIYIITNREPGTEQKIAEDLDFLGIEYNEIVITPNKAEYIRDHNITIFYENTDEYHLELDENVTVFKIREPGNFSFPEKKWITSKRNSIFID